MASSPITSWQTDGETMETVRDFILVGSKITADGECSHETKGRLLLRRKVMTNPDSILNSRDITLPTKVHSHLHHHLCHHLHQQQCFLLLLPLCRLHPFQESSLGEWSVPGVRLGERTVSVSIEGHQSRLNALQHHRVLSARKNHYPMSSAWPPGPTLAEAHFLGLWSPPSWWTCAGLAPPYLWGLNSEIYFSKDCWGVFATVLWLL